MSDTVILVLNSLGIVCFALPIIFDEKMKVWLRAIGVASLIFNSMSIVSVLAHMNAGPCVERIQ